VDECSAEHSSRVGAGAAAIERLDNGPAASAMMVPCHAIVIPLPFRLC